MKKLFSGINLKWPILIISAIVIGVSVGLLNSVPALFDTTITDIATYFDFWIFCGIFIIMNSKSNKDSALKCFIFFLISQPLIYLVEVPFNSMGWQLFRYYKPWFIWTIFCIPMGYIGYYIKKDKWYGLLILLPVMVLLGSGLSSSIYNLKYSFPNHLVNTIFIVVTFILYGLLLFKDKKLKTYTLIMNIIIMLIYSYNSLTSDSTYETTLKCNSEEVPFNENYKAYLEDSEYGTLSIEYNTNLEDYCLKASLKKPGSTKVVLENPSGEKTYYDLTIGKNTYSFNK